MVKYKAQGSAQTKAFRRTPFSFYGIKASLQQQRCLRGRFLFEGRTMEFNPLYQKILPILKRIAARYQETGVFLDRDDLLQEMSIHLWGLCHREFPAPVNRAYIVRSCQLFLFNYLRKRREKGFRVNIDDCRIEAGNESISRTVDKRMTFEKIANNGFSRKEKQVLYYLRFGYTVREIAVKLGISHVMVVKYKKKIAEKWQAKVTNKERNLLK